MVGSEAPIRALIIEDQEDDTLLLLNALKRGGYRIEHERVDNRPDLSAAMKAHWDIIFSDHSMPHMNGVEALALVRDVNPDVPFIFVSGTIGEDIAVEAMRNGAQDYIMKDNLKRLVPAVNRELKDFKVRKARRDAERRLLYLARYDNLTGLPNRLHFIDQLRENIRDQSKSNETLAVIYIDLDRFKSVNDSLGYDAGDQLLKEAAQRLVTAVGDKGLVARFAADEFALLVCGDTAAPNKLVQFVNSVFLALDKTYNIYGWSMYVSASVGVSLYPSDDNRAEDLLRSADIAAYRVKQNGGRAYLFYTSDMAVQLEERLALERNMRLGIEKNEFCLHYQPQVELSSGKIVGVEALLRWDNEERGMVSPATFIPLAEQTGFILPLGRWVLREVCSQIKSWQAAGLAPIRVAVNISARQFLEDNLPEFIAHVLAEYNVDPGLLEVEITETTIMRDTMEAIRLVHEIKALGITVALDDFGTGYSSLSYLKSFKTDFLKIDQSFIRGLPDDPDDAGIVSAIIAMAEKLAIKTIAEGVETKAQYDFLERQGCTMVQGYFISRPQLPKHVEILLEKIGRDK